MRVDTYPLPYPWSFGPKLCLSLARGERLTFSVQTLFAPPTLNHCHEVQGGSPAEEFLKIYLFLFYRHRPTTSGCRAKD